MFYKVIGILLMLVGAWIVIYFPDKKEYQHSSMTKTGVWLGIFLFVIGLLMLLFM